MHNHHTTCTERRALKYIRPKKFSDIYWQKESSEQKESAFCKVKNEGCTELTRYDKHSK
jgi:hypothetical protein